MSAHLCHAAGCSHAVPPKMLMCLRHWRMVPRDLQKRVWAEYVPGQETRKDPTPAYMEVQRAAVAAVAAKEGVDLLGRPLTGTSAVPGNEGNG